MTPHQSDLAAARSGDQQAFGRLIEARWVRIVRLARSIVGDMEADDVAQESCVACWRHLSQLSDAGKFDNWLLRIVFRRAIRRARWQRWRTGSVAALSDTFAVADPSSDLFVRQVLAHLPPRQRAVLHLTVVEGRSDTEIASALGIRAGSVRAHRRRARETIAALSSASATTRRGPTGDLGLPEALPATCSSGSLGPRTGDDQS